MITIKNINSAYGTQVIFSGNTLAKAVSEMQSTVRSCGPEFASVEITDDDYEIVCTRDIDGLLEELRVACTRDDAGRHFTGWMKHMEGMEERGLIEIDRPVHESTGIPYSQEYWRLHVTQIGLDMINEISEDK